MRHGAGINPPGRFETLHYERDAEVDEDRDLDVQYFRDPSRSIVARNQSPDLGFDASINPYRGCAHGCSYCLSPATPVLRADLSLARMAEIQVGDALLGFDEHASPDHPRKLRAAVVLAHWWSTQPTLRIVTETAEILASTEHRWLDTRGRWRRTDQLTLATKLRRLPIDTPPTSSSIDDAYRGGYIAGMTLGDGTMRFQPGWRSDKRGYPTAYWRVALKDREPLERLVAYLRCHGIEAAIRHFDPGPRSTTPMEKVEVRSLAKLERLHRIVRVERTSQSYRRGFVAGFFDAAGHHSGCLRISQVAVEVLARVQAYALDFGFTFKLEHRPGATSSIRLVGPRAERMRFLQVFEPAISRKVDVIYGTTLQTIAEPIRAIEPGPRRSLVDIQTTTGTFFASGLATHNCYARPTHEYLGLSAGLDFETKIFVKEDAPDLLRRELGAKRWEPRIVAVSGVTDAYQPIERKLGITRRCLEVLLDYRNPVWIVTKGHLVARDADLLAGLAAFESAAVSISVTTLDPAVQRVMEPRAPRPELRLRAIETLARAGVPIGVLVAPIVPGLTDHEIPRILEAAAAAGATHASYVLLRLPHGTKEIFEEWLERHFPTRKQKVLSRLRALRGGQLYDARFGERQRGTGLFADQIAQLFAMGVRRAGMSNERPRLSTRHFRRPRDTGVPQLALF
jgi:DNA repair photolyase